MALVPKVMKLDSKKEGGESFGGVIVQQIDENGKSPTSIFNSSGIGVRLCILSAAYSARKRNG